RQWLAGATRDVHDQDLLHRARFRGGRSLHAVPWRARHCHRDADRAHVAPVAQLYDHRRARGDHAGVPRPRSGRALQKTPTIAARIAVPSFLALVLGVTPPPPARSQEQSPSRTVRIIVPTSPGYITDVLARAIGQALSQVWGQPVIIDNRPGADELIGNEVV